MTLHTLSTSPTATAFADCLRLIAPGDALLLLGDGVYAALAGTAPRTELDHCGARLYVLQEDAAAAGVLGRLDGLATVDMDGFVELSERFTRQLAWY